MQLELVAPAERYRETFLRALVEFQREGLPWWTGGDLELAGRDFAAFVARRLMRGRGVATEMVRQALPVARALGLYEVLFTCDDSNAASIRVIEKNGGSLRETRTLAPDRPPKRYYWISLRAGS